MNPHAGQPLVQRGPTPEESGHAVVMVHGRGRDTADILSLAERIGRDDLTDLTYLAPSAEGGTWYPTSFLEPIEANEPRLSFALEVVDGIVGDLLSRGVIRERIALCGFSQGACLVTEYAMRNPARYGAVLAFTGGLIGPPGTEWENEGGFDGTPVYLGTSDVDEFVPEWRVRESAEVFRKMGAEVTMEVFSGMDHVVNDAEISAAREILEGWT